MQLLADAVTFVFFMLLVVLGLIWRDPVSRPWVRVTIAVTMILTVALRLLPQLMRAVAAVVVVASFFPLHAEAQRILQRVVSSEVACKDYEVLVSMRDAPPVGRSLIYLAGDCLDLEPGMWVVDETQFTGVTVSWNDRCYRPMKPTEHKFCYWSSLRAVRANEGDRK